MILFIDNLHINYMKLNFGAGINWEKDGWFILDHKIKTNNKNLISFNAEKINLKNCSCDTVFSSHTFEHISHLELPLVISELNRVMKKNSILRIVTPDLEKICRAYVKKDTKFFKRLSKESKSLRTDLGKGGTLMNFIISPGQDNVLLDRNLNNFKGGYAHIYLYDFKMLSIILKKLGFKVRKAKFLDSSIKELREPLHVVGMKPKWKNLNNEFYKRNGLIHKLVKNTYKTNFKLTGFDKAPIQSLFIEAKKVKYVNKQKANKIFNYSKKNYNRYAFSLLYDKIFLKKLKSLKIKRNKFIKC